MALHGAIVGISTLRLILGERTVQTLLGMVHGQRHGKPKEGVCQEFPVHNLVTLPLG